MSTSLLWSESLRLVRHSSDIRRLRSFVLDQAIQGKLVRQNPDDEPADVWLKRTVGVRQSSAERRPVPHGWMTVRLSDISRLVTSGSRGWAQYYSNDGALFVRSQNVREGYLELVDRAYVTPPDGGEGTRTRVQVGDLLVVITGDVGHVGLWVQELGEAYVSQHLALVRPLAKDIGPWLLTALLAPQCGQAQLRGGIYGGKPGLNLTQVRQLEVPIPPLSEQCRIVAKVDELMDLCDELEAAQTRREETRDRLRTASLAQLTASAETPGKVDRRAVTFFLSHSHRMVTKAEHVTALRQVIVDLAVAGHLTVHAVQDADGLPRWDSRALRDVCASIVDGDHQPPPQVPHGVPFLVIGNVRGGSVNFTGSRCVPREYYESLDDAHTPRKGDVLYTLVGSFGIPVLVRDSSPFCVQRHIAVMRPRPAIRQDYLALALKARRTLDQAASCATGIAQKTVPLRGLRAISIPVPPLAEQDRIIDRVNRLMGVCDQLEASLAAVEIGRVKLLEAVLNEALEETGAEKLLEAIVT